MKAINLCLIISFILISGCSKYQLRSEEETVFTDKITNTITFCGEAFMSKAEAEKYAMQRACELTLTKGYTHFLVLEKSDQSQICALEDKPYITSTAPEADLPETRNPEPQSDLVRPNLTLKIACYNKNNAPAEAIDAQQYLDEHFPGLKFKKE